MTTLSLLDMSDDQKRAMRIRTRAAVAITRVVGCLEEGCDCWLDSSANTYRWRKGDWVYQGGAS